VGQRVIQRSRLGRRDDGSNRQRYRAGRKSQSGHHGPKAALLLGEDHPVVVVIGSHDLGDITPGGAVLMRRHTRAQRPKDEEQGPRNESRRYCASHYRSWQL